MYPNLSSAEWRDGYQPCSCRGNNSHLSVIWWKHYLHRYQFLRAYIQSSWLYLRHNVLSGDSNGCLFVSEFENAFSSKQNLKAREGNWASAPMMKIISVTMHGCVVGMVSFEFVEEVVVSKNMLLNRRGSINHMTMQVTLWDRYVHNKYI